MKSVSKPAVVFVALCAVSLTAVIGYALLRDGSAAPPEAAGVSTAGEAAFADAARRPHLLFRHAGLDNMHGKLGLVPLDALDGPRLMTSRSCERVYFAAGRGVCLSADRGMVTTYRAEVFDAGYQTRHDTALTGVPSRTRVAPDGRLAAFTYFVSGDSYATGGFSTRTVVIDAIDGTSLANLEDFAVTRDGAPFKSADFNFWGVTFSTERGKFYATLASGGTMHLIEGDVPSKTARVIREGIECPSLAPDGRRIAFKRRMPGVRLLWRIHVLDLASGTETPTAEARSVDDQIEWLDAQTVLYALPNHRQKATASMDIWAVPADGSGAPRVLVPNAESPAVVRPHADEH